MNKEVKKYRKIPIELEAYQTDVEMDIETLEGVMHASIGDYIVTGIKGEKYPVKPDIFVKLYEEVIEVSPEVHIMDEKFEVAKEIVKEKYKKNIKEAEEMYKFFNDLSLESNIRTPGILVFAVEKREYYREKIDSLKRKLEGVE